MRVFLSTLCALAAVWLLCPLAARAQANFSGKWAVNNAASDYGGVTPPKLDVITITQDGRSLAWSEVIVMADGSVERESWSGPMDGSVRPVVGPTGILASYKRDGTSHWTFAEGTSDLFMTLSADRKRIILMANTTLLKDKRMHQKIVYDRTK